MTPLPIWVSARVLGRHCQNRQLRKGSAKPLRSRDSYVGQPASRMQPLRSSNPLLSEARRLWHTDRGPPPPTDGTLRPACEIRQPCSLGSHPFERAVLLILPTTGRNVTNLSGIETRLHWSPTIRAPGATQANGCTRCCRSRQSTASGPEPVRPRRYKCVFHPEEAGSRRARSPPQRMRSSDAGGRRLHNQCAWRLSEGALLHFLPCSSVWAFPASSACARAWEECPYAVCAWCAAFSWCPVPWCLAASLWCLAGYGVRLLWCDALQLSSTSDFLLG
jgi:hypothetical protein